MKKTLIFISVLIIILSLFTACDKKSDEGETTTSPTMNDYADDNYSLTEPSFTVGAVKTSERFETGENEYQLYYYDENGLPAKLETYRNGKLVYYSLVSGADDMGNSVQEKYYTADGKFVAIFDNGIFFDESGKRLSEDYVQAQLDKLK